MSSCTRVVRNKALSGLAIPSQEGHEGVPLVFDVRVLGFYKWSRGRLRLLGYDPIPSPYKYDDQIITFAKMVNGIIVTTDKGFSKWEKSVILKQDKYEKMYTQLIKQLRKMKTDCRLPSLAGGAPP
ncbi:hypothetical protein DDW10_02350 [Sulfolobales archaeon SCGC AB-777_J03]|nr:hypothetical protein DDW10_02350 [Sulfolobales archaeon SCGC AB-777_J03]